MLRCLLLLLSCLSMPLGAESPREASDVEHLDQRFYDAIAHAPSQLQELLAPDFLYRTTTGSLLGKDALIQHLQSARVRLGEPVVATSHRLARPATVLSRGSVSLRLEDRPLQATFLHVWVGGNGHWKLLYRESEVLRGPATTPPVGDVN